MPRELLWNNKDVVGPWVTSRIQIPWMNQEAIGLGDGISQILAGVVYEGFNGVSIGMHVAALPGVNWCTREFLWMVFDYPFNQLGAKKIIGVVPAANLAAMRLDLHLGFVHEATLKDAHPTGDVNMLSMTRDQCRWLNFERKPDHGRSRRGQGLLSCTGT